MKKIDKLWDEIRTHYQLGVSAYELGRRYGVAHTTITRRAERDKIAHGELHRAIEKKANDINDLSEINKMTVQSQRNVVTDALNNALRRAGSINSSINAALNINQQNLKEVMKMPNVKDRIAAISLMKLTIADIFRMTNINMEDNNSVKEESKIKIYLPENGRKKANEV